MAEGKKVDSTTTFKDTLATKLKEIDNKAAERRKNVKDTQAAKRQASTEARKKKAAERKKKGASGGIRGLQGLKSL
jgi:hypothetical protein